MVNPVLAYALRARRLATQAADAESASADRRALSKVLSGNLDGAVPRVALEPNAPIVGRPADDFGLTLAPVAKPRKGRDKLAAGFAQVPADTAAGPRYPYGLTSESGRRPDRRNMAGNAPRA